MFTDVHTDDQDADGGPGEIAELGEASAESFGDRLAERLMGPPPIGQKYEERLAFFTVGAAFAAFLAAFLLAALLIHDDSRFAIASAVAAALTLSVAALTVLLMQRLVIPARARRNCARPGTRRTS